MFDTPLTNQPDQVDTSIERESYPLVLQWLRWWKAIFACDVPPAFGRERGTR